MKASNLLVEKSEKGWSYADLQKASIQLRSARLEDASALAALMMEGLNSRLQTLGPQIVVILHQHMITSRYCICIVAERQGKLVGYAAVLTSTRRFNLEFMLRKGLLCALIALPRLLKRENLHTALSGITYFPRSPREDPETELVSLVVSDEARSSGVGRGLLGGVVERLREQGIHRLKICTEIGNKGANALYRSHGCKLIRRDPFYRDNQVNVYECEIY